MNKKLRILLLEDVPEDAELVKRQLRKDNITFTSTVVDTREGFLKELKGFRPDLIIADYSLPSFNAMEAIEIVQGRVPLIPVVVCTGSVSEEIAVECIKAGAADYVIKEHITRLGSAVKSALEKKRALEEKEWAEEALRESEEKYRKHFEMISDAIYVIDKKTGRILDVNKAAISMYGYSREEWLKMKNTDVSAEPEKTREATKKVPEQIPIRFHKKKDGTIFPLEMSINTHVLKGRQVIICTARDITERQQAEEALRKSHEYTRNLIDSSLDMIIAVNNKRLITEFNHAAEEVFGYQREEVLGKHVNLLYANAKEGLAVHKKTVMNGRHIQEILNRRKNGETFPSLLSSSVLLDPSGEIVGVMGVSRDITHYKQDEELLQFQADVLLNVQDSVIVTDLEGQIIYWNTGATELYGYTADEMIGQNPVVLYPDQDPELLAENLKSIVQGKNLTGAWKGRHKDGYTIWIAMKTTLARDATGEPIGYIGVTRDITERKFAEEKLKLSNEIITHIENLVLVFNERGEVIFTGPSVTRVLGYSITEILGEGWCELTCRDDEERKAERAYIVATIKDKEKIRTEPYERRIFDKEGRPRWILWQDARGPGNTLIEIGHDITEYKSLESQLIQGEKLRAVGELAAGIAHEINSPIQFIGDNLRFLEEANQKTSGLLKHIKRPDEIRKGDERLSGVLDAQSHELSTKDIDYFSKEIPKAIEQSLDGISRISEIVQAMRAFSHPGGKEKTTIDINQAIESTITVSRNEWKYVAELQTDLDPNLPPVPCLAGEINQVFLNLIVNAAQAIQETQEAGVSQEKGTIAISTRQEKGNLEVHISDNGPGVPEEIKSRIFEPFFTTKGVGRGTGQGLAIAHMVVVEKHGGSVTLETEKGKGATFIIRLPFEPPLEKEPA